MSGWEYRDGKIAPLPECPPGLHSWEPGALGWTMRCDRCATISTISFEGAARLARFDKEPATERVALTGRQISDSTIDLITYHRARLAPLGFTLAAIEWGKAAAFLSDAVVLTFVRWNGE